MTEGDLKRHFGSAIKQKRTELGISQEELADRAGLHRTYISDVERGMRNISLESIEKLAAALQHSISGLFAQAGTSGPPPPLVEILLVEDLATDIELTRRAFDQAKLRNPLHVIRDGVEALHFLFATGPWVHRRDLPLPQVILLDLNLPRLSGIEVLQKIKADARTRSIPVIILTASEVECDEQACRALGAQNYIVKPVDFRKFSEVTGQMEFGWKLIKRSPEDQP